MNRINLSRRNLLQLAAASGILTTGIAACTKPKKAPEPKNMLMANHPELAELERISGGRLGVAILNTATGAMIGHRANEHFAMCSTFKLPLAAIILRKADRGEINLNQSIGYSKKDIISNSPISQENLGKGEMTIGALAQATQTTSDNTAANLLLPLIGGPEGFTRELRQIGDQVTRADRNEPSANIVVPGDKRDTTQPAAMAQTLAHMLLSDYLKPASRKLLIDWMITTKTGAKRLRAGLPAEWIAGDKTGTGSGNTDMPNRYNDVAIVWPAGKAPIIITSYYESPVISEEMRDEDMAVLAQVGKIAASWAIG
jgi:beta-lactamase class A